MIQSSSHVSFNRCTTIRSSLKKSPPYTQSIARYEIGLNHRSPVSVLILTQAEEIGQCLAEVTARLGHRADWQSYETLDQLQSAVAGVDWDVLAVEGPLSIASLPLPLIDGSAVTLRLFCEDQRIGFVATGRPDRDLSPEGEWLVHALGRLLRQVA